MPDTRIKTTSDFSMQIKQVEAAHYRQSLEGSS